MSEVDTYELTVRQPDGEMRVDEEDLQRIIFDALTAQGTLLDGVEVKHAD